MTRMRPEEGGLGAPAGGFSMAVVVMLKFGAPP